MKNKNNLKEIEKVLKTKKTKKLAMVAPSFVAEFGYPSIIYRLKKLGFDKVTEVTFGAKMVNREYHKKLKKSKKFLISTACPGITEMVSKTFPQYKKNLIKVDSPMVAMGKICKKNYKGYKIFFISPCNFKKTEASNSRYIDYVIDYNQLRELFKKNNIKKPFLSRIQSKDLLFDRFYNDYTKVYPLSGGLSKTAHLQGILKPEETLVIDGWMQLNKFLQKPANLNGIRFIDTTFCIGGCIGGPCTNKKISLKRKHKRVLKYLKKSKKQDIPEDRKGVINKAKGLKFS